MLLIAGVAAMVTAGPIAIAGTGGDVDTLEKLWPGVRDSTEEVFISSDPNVTALVGGGGGGGGARGGGVVGGGVGVVGGERFFFFGGDFLHDDPESIRRQLLL